MASTAAIAAPTMSVAAGRPDASARAPSRRPRSCHHTTAYTHAHTTPRMPAHTRYASQRGSDAAKRPTTSATSTVPSHPMTVKKWFATSACLLVRLDDVPREEQRHGDDGQARDDMADIDDAFGKVIERLSGG